MAAPGRSLAGCPTRSAANTPWRSRLPWAPAPTGCLERQARRRGHSICAAIVFFTWGEIFSLFPSTTTDIFGPQYATTNTALMYSAKGVSAFVVPLANVLKVHTGSWHAVFVVSSVLNILVVLAALFVIRPMRLSAKAAEKDSPVVQPAE